MSVTIVATALRTRTKQSAIKIRCMYGAIPGPAPRCQATTGRSTTPPTAQVKPTPVGTADKTSFAQAVALVQALSTAASCQDMRLRKISRNAIRISRVFTNSASATHRRSSTGPTISVSTSSTATRAPAASGPTCLRTRVCWTKSLRVPSFTGMEAQLFRPGRPSAPGALTMTAPVVSVIPS